MTYFVAGSNIFTQWLPTGSIFPEFRELLMSRSNFAINRAKLFYIHWSYNIFLIEGTFCIVGAFYGKENIRIINLPEGCNTENVILAGTDYNVYIILKNTTTYWLINLDDMKEVKKFELNLAASTKRKSKKKKVDDHIIKISVLNNSCLFLTEGGRVYSNFISEYVDTKHCVGKVVDVESGCEHFMLLTDAGKVYTWGEGGRLQLGHGDLESVDKPKELATLSGIKIVKIRSGGWHSVALSESGDAYIWGWNDVGQLGIDENESDETIYLPELIDLFKGNKFNIKVKDIGCGSKHTAILLEDNSVWATGYNKYGQLGLCPDSYPILKEFRRVRSFPKDVEMRCGPWNIVVISQ